MKKSNVDANNPAPPPKSGKNAAPPDKTGLSGITGLPPDRPDHATRFRKGASGNPKGRPPKVKPQAPSQADASAPLTQSTFDSRAVLAANARRLTDHAVEMALKGSPTALRLCLDRINPVMKDRPVQLDLPTRKTTAQDLLATHDSLLARVADGSLTPLEAEAVSRLLEARRRSWESVEMETRVIQLQDDANAAKKIGPPPPKITWVDSPEKPSQEMPSQAEQDRLDRLAMEAAEDEEDEEDDKEEIKDEDREDDGDEQPR